MEQALPFDSPRALEFNRARQDFIREFLSQIQSQANLRTAMDVGCGVGYFAKFLHDIGFEVVAMDARDDNVQEARKRYPQITFTTGDAEALSDQQEPCDLVLCVGLLYHLENPFRAIRNLHALTSKVLFVEGMCSPHPEPIMELLDESTLQDQGLNFVAFYPSEACLVKMLYRSGFPFVYTFPQLPGHPLYLPSIKRKRERTMMVASKLPLSAPNFVLAPEPIRPASGLSDPWTTGLLRTRYFLGEIRRSIFRSMRRSTVRR